MRKTKKPNMRLLHKKDKKKEYNRFFIFLPDDSCFEYDLMEWDVYMNGEWVEVVKKNNLEMDCFATYNILRARFVRVEAKTDMKEVVQLKPVPPSGNDAA